MKIEYKHMMEEITLSSAVREVIANRIATKQKETAPNRLPLRAALIILCLCLLIPVTVTAVEPLREPVKLGQTVSGHEVSSFSVQADVSTWQLHKFSPELQDDLNSSSLQQIHNDKDALETYLGIPLISSVELENAGIVEDLEDAFAYGYALRPQFALDTKARYILTACSLDGTESEGIPEVLKVSAHRVMENAEIYLDAWILTEAASGNEVKKGLPGETYTPVTLYDFEIQLDENGYVVLDAKGNPYFSAVPYTTAEQEFASSTYKMKNGMTATIITARVVEKDGSLSFHDYTGYFIHNGILYSVKPYAVANPNMNYPMHDTDMLQVLKVVLDSFE